MRPLRIVPSLALALGILASARSALAHPTGEPGASGKSGGTCTGCHGTNTPEPTFDINLPADVTANQSLTVTLKVNGSKTLTAFDAAFDADAVVTPGVGAKGGNGASEIVSSSPITGASGTWTFTLKVPNRNGTLSLWVAALSADGDGSKNGDATGMTKVTATITGADGGVTAPPDDPTAPTAPTDNGATASSAVDAGPPVIIPHPILPDGDPGCQSAPGRAPDVLALAGIGAVVLGLRRRRPRKPQ